MKVKGDGSSFYEVLLESKRSIEEKDGRAMNAEEFGCFQALFAKLWELDDKALAQPPNADNV